MSTIAAMFTFSIEKWEAWAPGIHDENSWQEWASSPYCPLPVANTEALPDISFLPAMQRRRLSPLARMAFSCAWPVAQGLAPMPIVFASRHGETTRSFRLLQDLAADTPLSPTAFGLSVHNAIVGQWSIVRKETEETVALAGDEDMLEHAIQEACLLMHAGAPHVLVVVAEERPPEAYLPWIDDVPFSYAVALRLGKGADWHLKLAPAAGEPKAAIWPHTLSLLRHLASCSSSWCHSGPRRCWHWENHTAHKLAA